MEIQLDRIPLNNLMARYDIKKSALYDRINALKIKPEKTLKGSYINAQQLKLLDELNDFLKKGGKINEFALVNEIAHKWKSPLINSQFPSDISSFIPLVSEIAAAIKPQANPLQHLECLERASSNGWLLSTSVVRQLIGVKPHGKTFARGSFTFVRSGKIGREVGWRVEKV